MQRLLIANRGEIALRVVRSAREQQIETVSVYAAEDATLAQGYAADRCVALPGGHGAAAYLDVPGIVRLATETGCDALHPGYGFLSERASLASTCIEQGLVFVGPPPEALALFGDKARARALATQHDIPVVPGLAGPIRPEEVRRFLESLPGEAALLLKAVAGGGGRGMRRIQPGDDVEEAFARCTSEAERSFGSGALFAERFIDPARHIEIQILADAAGDVSHLWERDCSVQRRHQKLIEIAPAPALPPRLRDRMIDAAVTLARAGGLVGVGTFEFLVDPAGEAYFIEANPRLQVEHTVTEEITGVDLVAVQLALAAGRTLSELDLARPPVPRGHAVQLRVLAEDVDRAGELRPSAEPIHDWTLPSGPGVRLDTAMRPGLGAPPSFDSMLAKLVVTSPDPNPERLLARARRALAEFRITGPRTNLSLLSALLDQPEFGTEALTTRFVEMHAEMLAIIASERTETFGESIALGDLAATTTSSTSTAGPDPTLQGEAVAIRAPLIGTVIEWSASSGDEVAADQPLCVIESMKMEHVVRAAEAGRVTEVFAEIGETVPEGALLLALQPSTEAAATIRAEAAQDLDQIRPDLAAVRARHALLEDAKRPEAVARRRSRGQRTARENLAAVCDEGSFSEYGALAIAAMRRVRPVEELEAKTPADAILTGTGSVNGDLFAPNEARCALLVVDATVLAGTQGFFHHQKIDRILEVAEHAGMPVIFYPEGGGGRPNDTDASDVFVAGLNITSFHAFARLSGKVPRVAVVSGYCFAGSAAFAGCADVIIATQNANLGMGGPAMIEGGGLGVHAPQDVGPTSVQAPNGVVDLLVEDEEAAAVTAKQYLSYFQGPLAEWSAPDPRVLRHVIPENRRRVYDVRRLIEGLCDEGSILELRRSYGAGMITALIRLEGQPMGLIANDPMHLGGAIDDVGAEKAARFLQLCDAFGLPLLSICDTPGFMVGPEIEARAQVRKVSRLFVAGANVSVPLFCVITRKGYGLGAQAMAGGGFAVPFDTVAWPTGEIGGMGLEGAVNLGFKKQLEACESDAERDALFEKLVGVMYDKGKALHAASALEFDAVIDPADTRDRVLRGLRAFGPIARGDRGFIDTW